MCQKQLVWLKAKRSYKKGTRAYFLHRSAAGSCRHSPLLASQILTVSSLDADASRVESCEKATDQTLSRWPSSVCRHSPLLRATKISKKLHLAELKGTTRPYLIVDAVTALVDINYLLRLL